MKWETNFYLSLPIPFLSLLFETDSYVPSLALRPFPVLSDHTTGMCHNAELGFTSFLSEDFCKIFNPGPVEMAQRVRTTIHHVLVN